MHKVLVTLHEEFPELSNAAQILEKEGCEVINGTRVL